jgi:hypothetical protein
MDLFKKKQKRTRPRPRPRTGEKCLIKLTDSFFKMTNDIIEKEILIIAIYNGNSFTTPSNLNVPFLATEYWCSTKFADKIITDFLNKK